MDYTNPLPHAVVPSVTAVRPLACLRDSTCHVQPIDGPFMNNMDEISYWICTKQAPCLYNYDNVIKRQCEEAHCSKPKSVQSILLETSSPKKKKKRKLSLLDDESVSTSKQQNVYFETSQKKNQPIMRASLKSDTLGSDVNFNIKNTFIQEKSKRAKLNKSNRTQKKNKLVTSTPKVTPNLRRSSRKAQKRINNNNQLDNSFELYNNPEFTSNNNTKYNIEIEKSVEKAQVKKAREILTSGQRDNEKQNCNNKTERTPINGQFDDLSDVSGFTANYIRSTKIHSVKRSLRNKGGRNFMKESQNIHKDDDTMLVCVNKSVNTGLSKTPLLNCSTDSSQNIVNLITLKNNDKSMVHRSTSLLKFIDSKPNCKKPTCNKMEEKPIAPNINMSFQSKSSVSSRYPKRHKNTSTEDISIKFDKNTLISERRRRVGKNSLNNSDRKENPEEKLSRTRSGKFIGLAVRQPDNSVLVLSNSVEQVSSLASMNVATPTTQPLSRSRRRKYTNPQFEAIKKQEQQDSVRDKSGFTACFSDSDEDNEPLKEKKFFC